MPPETAIELPDGVRARDVLHLLKEGDGIATRLALRITFIVPLVTGILPDAKVEMTPSMNRACGSIFPAMECVDGRVFAH
ncbi:hypothetical protein SE17_20170 [Kouleothrix aurantiaca]|uniref:Uncharacterized protein n=1 Tax=Kouleothrix aurantiaca TaxID=186479 RepID=A0A0P9D8D8_9CHLR|nr:hypothetical protein SE17_20170 [Kouleothrix aurantiaca]